jgi:hypothetical protein
MKWGPVRDRICEGQLDTIRCWLLLNRQEKVTGIYIRIESVSKFIPATEFEETLEGAKFRAEFEIERYKEVEEIAKLRKK